VNEATAWEIAEASQTGEARRGAMLLARVAGLDEVRIGKVGIVVTEASTNMVKHAEGGRLVVQRIAQGSARGVETLALDRGPGMARLNEMMRDGFSTTGTSGTGLGAIERQSTQFEVYSAPGKGTAVFAGIWSDDARPTAGTLAIGGISVPVHGEEVCGDGWAVESHDGCATLLVVDGLGHGPLAHNAAKAAVRAFHDHPRASPEDLIAILHDALRSTRGAAATVMRIDPGREIVQACGVGNVEARITWAGGERRLVSQFGTLGHDLARIRGFQYPFPPGATLIVHSDGLSRNWQLEDYPGLVERHPTLIAGVLLRDHSRGRDDATAVVVRRSA